MKNDGTSTDKQYEYGTFCWAIEQIKNKQRVFRHGWGDCILFVFLVPGSRFKVNRPPLNELYEEGTEVEYNQHIDKKSINGVISPWTPSNEDIFARDWDILKDEKDIT